MKPEEQIQHRIAALAAQGLKPRIILLGSQAMQDIQEENSSELKYSVSQSGDPNRYYGFAGHLLTIHEVDNKDRNFMAVY